MSRAARLKWTSVLVGCGLALCLGELAVTRSFYYKSDHHDAIRTTLED